MTRIPNVSPHDLLQRLQVLRGEEELIVQRLAELLREEDANTNIKQQIEKRTRHFESMRGSVISYGDIVSPAADPDEWEANR